MASKNPITTKLMKDANNKAFGANTQRISGRVRIVPIVDKIAELNRITHEGTNEEFVMSISTNEDKYSFNKHVLDDALHNIDLEDPDAEMKAFALEERYNYKMEKMNTEPEGLTRYKERVSSSWKGTVEDKMYQQLRCGTVRSFQECSDARSNKYIAVEKPKTISVKSSRFVGTHVMAKAKVSIIFFANSVNDTFDKEKNPSVVNDMQAMQLSQVIMSLILTDTDSVYFNFLGVFNCANPLIEEEYFQQWVRETIILYNLKRIDTSNIQHSPFKDENNNKRLNMFQFETPIPNIKQIIAVNPKEYFCLYAKKHNDKQSVNKHKGIPRYINVAFEEYSLRVRSLAFLKEHNKALKSPPTQYSTLTRFRNKVFIKDIQKMKLGGLSDKVYVFQNGVSTLPHGHVLLEPIYAICKGKLAEEMQTDEHIEQLRVLEEDIERSHPRLKILSAFYKANEHIFV